MILGRVRLTFAQALRYAKHGYPITRRERVWAGAYLVWDPEVKGTTENGALILCSDDGGNPCRWSPLPGDTGAKDWMAIAPVGHFVIRVARAVKRWNQ